MSPAPFEGIHFCAEMSFQPPKRTEAANRGRRAASSKYWGYCDEGGNENEDKELN